MLLYRLQEETFNVSFGDGTIGLTCATFVLTIFHSMQIQLLQYDTWIIRERDKSFIERMLKAMGKGKFGFTKESAEKNAQQKLPCERFSPTDLIAACMDDNLPIDFQTSESRYQDIDNWMDCWLETVKRR